MPNLIENIKKEKLCIGCGLCESCFPRAVNVNLSNDGKYQIEVNEKILSERYEEFLEICPVYNKEFSHKIWGEYKNAYFCYSNDTQTRYLGSSGGTITSVLIYLLENNIVDVVIQIGKDVNNPIENKYYLSFNKNDVLSHCGSRYAPAKLLPDFVEILNKYDRVAVVGKPCDLRAVNNYLCIHPEYKKKVIYKISFFCGGIPSLNAVKKLLSKFNVSENNLTNLTYRGNGWPGYTLIETKSGDEYQMTYNQSWGEILGRDIHKLCKFCPDGLGECADISCGDAWYSTSNGYPDFEERDGRNIVLIRNSRGQELIETMACKNKLTVELIEKPEEYLTSIQIGQYFRKTSLFGKYIATKITGKKIPTPSIALMWGWRGNKGIFKQVKIALGTMKRVLSGRL